MGMFSYIRKRASYANVAATLALLFAMSGGALAATKYIITSTKQIKPSVLAQLKGRSGAPGASGLQGPQGPAGPAGAPGAKGDNGANGSNGSDGKAGSAGPKGATGSNGVTGATGPTGQTGFTKTLPSGETETGTWTVAYPPGQEGLETWTPVSFPIRLKDPSTKAFFINAKETEELDGGVKSVGQGECAGTLNVPTAPKGELCVYTEAEELHKARLINIIGREGSPGYEPAGAYIDFLIEEAGSFAALHGNWAVTAP